MVMSHTRIERSAPPRGETGRPLLSVVLPAHNESGVVGLTLERIAAVMRSSPGLSGGIEVIVVSDGSTDDTFVEARRALGPALPGTVVELAANAGSHAAIRCGLRYARGEHVAIMSADGQDPPEALPEMLAALRPPVDVVWGQRLDRAGDPRSARRAAAAYYRIFRTVTRLDYPPSGLDFVVVRRRVIEQVLESSSHHASLFLLIYNLGYAQTFVPYERAPRSGGTSSWTLGKRLKLATDMLTAYSPAPVRIPSLAGLLTCFAGMVLAGVVLLRGVLGAPPVPAWAALLAFGSAAGASILVALAFLGEYAWRLLDELRKTPTFIEARREHVTGTAQEDGR